MPGILKISKSTVTKWLVLIAIVLIQFLTVVLLKNTERFYVEKQQLLNDPEFLQADTYWRQQGEGYVQPNGKAISLVNDEKANHFISQTVPIEQPGHYRVNFEAAVHNVASVAKNYGGAEVIVVYRNSGGMTNGHGKRLFLESGSKPLAPYSRTIHLGREIGSVDIAARLKNASGKLTVSSIELSRLQELPLFKRIKFALLAIWVLLFAAFGWVALRVFTRTHAILLAGVLFVGLVGVLLPDGLMTSLNSLVKGLLPTTVIAAAGKVLANLFGYTNLGGSGAEIGKMGHFAVFLILGVIAGLNFRKTGAVFSLALIAVFASLTEVLQLLVVGRTASVNDFLIDVSAGTIGMCFGVVIYLFFGGDQPALSNRKMAGNVPLPRSTTIKNLKNSLKSLRL